jgi:hypothetical protein
MFSPINQITTLRLPDGQQVAFVDWTDQPLYSTCDIMNGATDEIIPLFNYVVSDQVSSTQNITTKRTATEADTNISTPNGLSSTEEFLIYSVKPEFAALVMSSAGNATTAVETLAFDPLPSPWQLGRLFRSTVFEILISQKLKHRAPFAYWPTGFGVFSQAGAAGTVAAQSAIPTGASGIPSAEASRCLTVPIHIGGQEKFEIQVRNPTSEALNIGLTANAVGSPAANAQRLYRVRVCLEGLYKKPVS